MAGRVSDSENAPKPEENAPKPESGEVRESAGAGKDLGDLLANFALGPAWAKAGGGEKQKYRSYGGEAGGGREGKGRRKDGGRHGGGGHDGGRYGGGRGPKGGGRFAGKRRDGGGGRDFRRDDFVPPAAGVRVTITPDAAALHLIVKEIHQVARVYSLFDIAETLLAERKRCRAVFEAEKGQASLWRGKLDDSLFLTRAEAAAHMWGDRALRNRFVDEETVETEPPSGNFVAVARCGISGEWLGPPNFHTYQTNIARLHRERFPNMPLDAYKAKVRTERGEEAVNAWLESMKLRTRWRLKSVAEDDGAWTDDPGHAARMLGEAVFDEVFEAAARADLSASVPAANLSPGLLSALKRAGSHARKHPAMLIPAICKMLEAEHLPVFKRKGKLYTGPARPQALPSDAVLAERPARMVEWIRANPPAKLEGLWQAVLPEGGSAPPAEYAADLFWMLQQGHVLLFTDDTLMVQEYHEPPAKKAPKKKAAKKKAVKAVPEAGVEKPVKEKTVPEEPVADGGARAEPEIADTAGGGDAPAADAAADVADQPPVAGEPAASGVDNETDDAAVVVEPDVPETTGEAAAPAETEPPAAEAAAESTPTVEADTAGADAEKDDAAAEDDPLRGKPASGEPPVTG